MHVAIAYWVAFVLSLRGVRWIGPIFVVLISAGAVALGWHYSADVLAGLLVALAGIAVSKPFVLRSGEEQQTRPAGACLAGPDVSNQPL
jgi:membrane-associated phospholipid phosphatase